MTCIAAIEADLELSPVGTRSRLADKLCGRSVLTRTVERMCRASRVRTLFVICPAEQTEACRGLLPPDVNGKVVVRDRRIPHAPFRQLVRTARKWSLDGWRGGLGGTCSMDEYTRADELALLAHEEKADRLICASAASPLIDPVLMDQMIQHSQDTADESRLTFAQAPPGLVGTVYQTDLLIELGRKHIPPGFVLSYKPDAPQMDLAFKSCCYTATACVRHATGRLIVDTDRAFGLADAYLRSGRSPDAESVGRWLIERESREAGALPREVEIELTTDDQLPDALLRPRGSRVEPRGPMDLDGVRRIGEELARYDDSLVVLGGYGEPLLHARFGEVLGALKEAGVYGLAVRTNGIALDDDCIDLLIDHEVDIVNVVLDAWTPETYAVVQGVDRLALVRENIVRLTEARARRPSVWPILVPEMTKSIETVHEMEPFFDGWVRETGWANISGFSHFAGQLADRAVMCMCPPRRSGCRRIQNRMLVLADGRVPLCDQDFNGRFVVGDLSRQSIEDIWTGMAMNTARSRHQEGHFDAIPLCAGCEEYHRP